MIEPDSPQRLAIMLQEARARTLALVEDLSGAQLIGPKMTIVNPPLWELGHIAWFQEHWCLRDRAEQALTPSILRAADALYDSSAVAHDVRWDLPLPSLDETLSYMHGVLDRVLQALASRGADPRLLYFAELAALHEEMHCEAFSYTRQTLGYRRPRDMATIASVGCEDTCEYGDIDVPGGAFELGARAEGGFVFDNEKWAHEVHVAPFSMSRTAVNNAQFAAFVEDDGYARPGLWSSEGWHWRSRSTAAHPVYWHRDGSEWLVRDHDRMVPLLPHLPIIHVNRYEARAYCRWAGRRLPSEVEWEYAAATERGASARKRRHPWGDEAATPELANVFGAGAGLVTVGAYAAGDSAWGFRQMTGNVWEWTASTFAPYPGYVVDPYKEYSRPWFGTHGVLRGGSFATRGHLIRNTWRNFFTPDRRDIYAGFRTCA
jgi:gamma-glutamyl hercynylcysteine S-oxide synthase